jgi:hypothetical protein
VTGCLHNCPYCYARELATRESSQKAEQAFAKIKDVKVKWLSLEPLCEELRFNDLSVFDWVVITATWQPDGKGGTKLVPEFAPPFRWVFDLVAQAPKAGCKIWLKPNLLGQVDPQHPGMTLLQEIPDTRTAKRQRAG